MGRRELQNEADKTKKRFLRWTEKLCITEERVKTKGLNKAKSVINTMDNIIKDKAVEPINSTEAEDRLNHDKHNTIDTEPLKTEHTE